MTSRRQWFLTAVVFIAIVVTPFAAKAMEYPLGDRAELLSYSELMSLTPEKRETYLQSVRNLLIEIAAITDKNKSDFLTDSTRQIEDYFALVNSLMSEANAATVAPKRPLQSPVQTVPVMTGTNGRFQTWECPHNLMKDYEDDSYVGPDGATNQNRGKPLDQYTRKIMNDNTPGTLKNFERNNDIYRRKTTRGNTLSFDYRLGTCRIKGVPQMGLTGPKCPQGYELVKGQDTQRKQEFSACVPGASWDAIPTFRQRELKSIKGARDVRAIFGLKTDGSPDPRGNMVSVGAVGKLREGSLRNLPPGWKIVRLPDGSRVLRAPKPPPPKVAPVRTTQVARADGKSAPAGRDSKQVSGTAERRTPAPAAAPAVLRDDHTDIPVETERASEPKIEIPPVTEASHTDENGNVVCAIRETDCSQIDREEAKKAFFSETDANNIDCIFAGNVSQYIDGNKRPGRCQAIYKFSYSSGSQVLSCGSYKKIVCNPLVFGLQRDGSAFCVDAKSNATRDCNMASTKETRRPDPLNLNTPGIKEAWDNFAKGFNRLCKTQGRRQYFCSECNVMSARVYEMRMLVLGEQGCGEAKLADGGRDTAAAEASASGTVSGGAHPAAAPEPAPQTAPAAETPRAE